MVRGFSTSIFRLSGNLYDVFTGPISSIIACSSSAELQDVGILTVAV